MRPYLLAETTWAEVKVTDYELAVLPWGATEAHNYHLPYATDNIQAEAVAYAAAKEAWEAGKKVIVLPTLPFGVNTGQADIKLDINLNPSTQLAILDDIIATLVRHGIPKLLVYNGHGGNDFKTMLRELGLKYPDIFLCTTNFFRALPREEYFSASGDHADELETSLMMHVCPELVRPLDLAGDGRENLPKIRAFKEGWVWTERKWSSVTADTGVGNPAQATAAKGERYFNDLTAQFSQLFIDLAQIDPNNFYEEN
jgi:creatinine amidohydrolase